MDDVFDVIKKDTQRRCTLASAGLSEDGHTFSAIGVSKAVVKQTTPGMSGRTTSILKSYTLTRTSDKAHLTHF